VYPNGVVLTELHNGKAPGAAHIYYSTYSMYTTGLFGGARGYWTFVFERDPDVGDDRFDRDRGFRTGLL
jgi:hypothetical protein